MMNGHSSPQMMVAKPKQRNTFLRDNLGLGLGHLGLVIVFSFYIKINFDMIINIILI